MGEGPLFIDPLDLAVETGAAGQGGNIFAAKFIAAFGPDCFALPQLDLEVVADGNGLIGTDVLRLFPLESVVPVLVVLHPLDADAEPTVITATVAMSARTAAAESHLTRFDLRHLMYVQPPAAVRLTG